MARKGDAIGAPDHASQNKPIGLEDPYPLLVQPNLQLLQKAHSPHMSTPPFTLIAKKPFTRSEARALRGQTTHASAAAAELFLSVMDQEIEEAGSAAKHQPPLRLEDRGRLRKLRRCTMA
jgi:hypothetical protein